MQSGTTYGMICDQAIVAAASIMTYRGYGLDYNGVPLAESAVTRTLILSNGTAPIQPGSELLTFPPAPGEQLVGGLAALVCSHDVAPGCKAVNPLDPPLE
jgi:hypothetical protein